MGRSGSRRGRGRRRDRRIRSLLILTDRLLRMEWSSETGDFEDRATMAIINRHMPVPDFTTNNDGTTLTISTTSLKLTWSVGEAFSADTLSVASLDDSSAFESWAFGQADPGNLLGTIRTLDGEDLPTLNCSLVQSQMNNQCGWDDRTASVSGASSGARAGRSSTTRRTTP